jgi:hypothetical protein
VPRSTRTTGTLAIEVDGLMETLKAVNQLEREFARPHANAQLRDAAGRCGNGLADELVRAASASGVPVAPRVARSVTVKRDRLPVVSIGGGQPVGRHGDSAGSLVWGSEQGPKGAVNHFAVAPSSGYWVAPAVKRFGDGPAVDLYRRAVFDVLKASGLV